MKVIIEPYDKNWNILFEKEHSQLMDVIDEKNVSIEHIGSTSINNLGAKPIIDIMIGLVNFQTADSHISAIEKLGYNYINTYEDIMPYRRFFIKDINGKRTHHIHMVQFDSEFWIRHLLFRNFLRKNPSDLEEYYHLKVELSKQEWKDGSEYANAKSNFIESILEKAANNGYKK